MKRSRSLSRIFALYTLVAVSLFLVTVIFSILMLYRYTGNASRSMFDNYARTIDNQLDQYTSSFANIEGLCYSGNFQNAVFNQAPASYEQDYGTARQMLDFITLTNPHIDSVFIIAKNGTRFSSSITSDPYTDSIFSRYQQVGTFSFAGPFYSTIVSPDASKDQVLLFYLFPFQNEYSADQADRAVCGILCNIDSVIQSISLDYSDYSILSVISQHRIMSTSRPLSDTEALSIRSGQGNGTVSINGEKWQRYAVHFQEFDWNLVYLIPQRLLFKDAYFVRNLSLIMITTVFLSGLSGLYLISRRLSKPIFLLAETIGSIKYNTAGAQAAFQATNISEIDQISSAIRKMLETIQASYETEGALKTQLYQSMLAQTRSQLYAYRCQINPHFLFNTMECMRSMADFYQNENLEAMISSLAQMLRYSLHSEAISSVAQELAHIKNYCTIMNYRIMTPCALELTVSPGSEEFLLPSLTLQPIIENSFRHGFTPQIKSPRIQVAADKVLRDGQLYLHIEILDNGRGIPQSILRELRQKLLDDIPVEKAASIGLRNINQRCQIMFPGSILTLDSSPAGETRVGLLIPQNQNEELHDILSGKIRA